MRNDPAKPLPAIGFLTAVEDPQHGIFGGYLVVSTLGRPLEFHCTTPVSPTSAQEILYGSSIGPYLYGELIGQTLLAKSQLPVQAVLTDKTEMLAVQLWRDEPIAWLLSEDTNSSSESPIQFEIEGHILAGEQLSGWTPESLEPVVRPLCQHVDLAEPFERIVAAIAEAQRMSDPREGDDHAPANAA